MADLSKFGVPLNGTKLGMLQPKQQFKYRVVFLGIGFDADSRIMTQQVMTATRPQVDFNPVEVHSYVSTAYVEGKPTWNTVDITLRDDISNGVISVIGQQIQKQMNFFEQTMSVAGANYKFTTEIHTLDGRNTEELEKWVLDGCFISSYQSPQGDYASSEVNQITITLRYDVATHMAGSNTNDGTTVGADPFPNTPSLGGRTGIA